jgi:hypothetical protein
MFFDEDFRRLEIPLVLGVETEEQGHQRVFDQMERASSRGRYLG